MTRRSTTGIAIGMTARLTAKHFKRLSICVFAFMLTAAVPKVSTRDLLELLRADDLRLASVGERLAVANRALCRDQRAWAGLVVHTLDQYQPAVRADAIAAFAFPAPVTVELVLPGGAAAEAGIVANDGLLALGTQPFAQVPPKKDAAATTRARDAAENAIAALPPGVPVAVRVKQGSAERLVNLTPRAGCRTRFEVHEVNEAAADGSIVQIGAAYMDAFDAKALPVIVAHELAHIILKHRARMEAAGVSFGAFSDLGRSGRLHRQAEAEADLLSVYLLYNAGYNPRDAAAFWRGPGRSLDGGLFRSRAYPSWRDRAAALEAEAAKIPASGGAPVVPPMIALADQPMQ